MFFFQHNLREGCASESSCLKFKLLMTKSSKHDYKLSSPGNFSIFQYYYFRHFPTHSQTLSFPAADMFQCPNKSSSITQSAQRMMARCCNKYAAAKILSNIHWMMIKGHWSYSWHQALLRKSVACPTFFYIKLESKNLRLAPHE